MAEALGVAGGLMTRLDNAGFSCGPLMDELRVSMILEMQMTASMKRGAKDLFGLLEKHGVRYSPLKGSDPRLSEGARGFFNAMQDIDILIDEHDIAAVGSLLDTEGYQFHGMLSGSHLTYFTNDHPPVFIEVHWDLVNRLNPLHTALFAVPFERIRERLTICEGHVVLSPADLLAYSIAHAVKEYFHKPKWLADIAWIIETILPGLDAAETSKIIGEWGMGNAFGIAAAALDKLIPDKSRDYVRDYGAVKPMIAGRYLASRLVAFTDLRGLRPLLFFTTADGVSRKIAAVREMAGWMVRTHQ